MLVNTSPSWFIMTIIGTSLPAASSTLGEGHKSLEWKVLERICLFRKVVKTFQFKSQ